MEGPEFSRVTPLFPVRKIFRRELKDNTYSKFTTAKIVKILVTVVSKLLEVPSIPMLTSRKKYEVRFLPVSCLVCLLITSPIYVNVKRM